MNTSKLYQELASHVVAAVSDFENYDVLLADLHNEMFNISEYIIGTYNASESLKTWDIEQFDMISFVQGYENDNFGETNTPVDIERMVNMLVYIVGEEVIDDTINALDLDTDDIIDSEMVQSIKVHLA